MRDALRALLVLDSGIDVIGDAADGHAAVGLTRALKPDVVILDVTMPGLNGVEAARQIAAFSDARVVMLSTHCDARLAAEALRAGAISYVAKIAAGEELVRAVHAAAAGVGFVSPAVGALDTAFDVLGPREREVLQLVAEGRTSEEAARLMHVSEETVSSHRRNIQRKLGVRGTAALTRYALRERLTIP